MFPSTITEPPVLTTHTSPSIQKSYSVITFSGRSPNQTESTSQPSLLSTFSQYTTAVTSEGVYTSTETTEPPPTTNSTSAITLNTRSTVVQHDDWIFDKLITIPWGVAGGLIFLVANGGILSRFVGRTACNRVSPWLLLTIPYDRTACERFNTEHSKKFWFNVCRHRVFKTMVHILRR